MVRNSPVFSFVLFPKVKVLLEMEDSFIWEGRNCADEREWDLNQ